MKSYSLDPCVLEYLKVEEPALLDDILGKDPSEEVDPEDEEEEDEEEGIDFENLPEEEANAR